MLLLRLEGLLFPSRFLTLLKACVLLDQFSDKLCTHVHSRTEVDLEVQTNVHLQIQQGKGAHALSLEPLQTCRRWLHVSA